VIFCDRCLADGSYRHVLLAAANSKNHVPVVVTSKLADRDEYREVLREGAWDLIASPCHPTDVLRILGQVDREENTNLERPEAFDRSCRLISCQAQSLVSSLQGGS